MERIIVERTLDEPTTFEKFLGISEKAPWCLNLYRLRFLGGYLSPDGRRLICNYEAPDAEAVRAPSRQFDIPFDRIWSATVLEGGRPVGHLAPIGLPKTGSDGPAFPVDMEFVIAERRFDKPIELHEIHEKEAARRQCFQMYNATLIRTYLSKDRQRMICLYYAPDAEAVRIASRRANAPTERIWTATIHEEPAVASVPSADSAFG